MRRGVSLYGISAVAHLALGVGLGGLHRAPHKETVAITLAEAPRKHEEKKTPAPAPPDEPVRPRAPAAPEIAKKAAPSEPPPAAPPPSTNTGGPDAPSALADFGLTLGGGVGGGGLAIPTGGPARPASSVAPVTRRAQVLAPKIVDTTCDEPLVKPKPRSIPQPVYPADQRAANIDGKVRVEIQVDETGRVAGVRVLSGLGAGFDEAALEAARHAVFEQPATRCGKAVASTFTVGMRFSL